VGVKRFLQQVCVIGLFIFSLPLWAVNLLVVYEDAFKSAPMLQRADYLKRAARSDYQVAGSVFLPQINITGSIDKNDVATQATYQSSSLTFTVTQILFHRKAWYAAHTKGLSAEASKHHYQATLQNFIYLIAFRYFSVLEAKQKAIVAKASYDEFQNFYDKTLKQYQVGSSSGVDLAKAKAGMDEAYAGHMVAMHVVSISEEQLATLTGHHYQEFSHVNPDYRVSLAEFDPQEDWKAKALAMNQEIKEKVLFKDIQKELINVERSSYIPTVSLFASVTNYNQNLQGVYSDNGHVNNHIIGIQFDWTVFEGSAYAHKIAKQRSLLLASDYDLTLKRKEIAEKVQADWLHLHSALSEQDAYARMVDASNAALHSYQAQFETGTVTMVDVLEKIKDHYQAQADYYHAQYHAILSWLAFKRDVGILDLDDLKSLNAALTLEN
jgi:TolC family type I secretion outer membrane protein